MRVKIFSNTEGKNFLDYSQYVLSKADLSTILCSRGVITSSPDMIGSSFFVRWSTSPNIKHPAVHMVIQFREEENMKTSNEDKIKLVTRFFSEMRWNDCQYIAVMHNDVPRNTHCHLVINLINDEGKKANDSYSILKARRIIREITISNFGRQMLVDPEKEERIQNMVLQAINESYSVPSLRENLLMEMIEMDIDSEGKIKFNEIGNPISFSFAGITALEIWQRMHQIVKKEEQKQQTRCRVGLFRN